MVKTYSIELIESIIILVLYIAVLYFNKTLVNNTLKKFELSIDRRRFSIKGLNLMSTVVFLIVLSAIWGVKQSDIAVFLSTILTVLGIAFFAQWSLLSNITSALLLFFNHPLRIGDQLEIIDKDHEIKGIVTDLTYFFIYIITDEKKMISLPNNVLLQKAFSISHKDKD